MQLTEEYKDYKEIIKKKNYFYKRIFDLLLSFSGIIFFAPLMAVISLAIILEDGFPVLYSQERAGKNGRIFKFYKFRSMVKEAEKNKGAVLAGKDDSRVTRVGRILRATALDELLQLFNILKGDLSFVGPRPERPEAVALLKKALPNYDLRHHVRPGLTGLAQVYARYNTPDRQKLRFDILYVQRRTLWLDLKLILQSIRITCKAKWDSLEKKR